MVRSGLQELISVLKEGSCSHISGFLMRSILLEPQWNTRAFALNHQAGFNSPCIGQVLKNAGLPFSPSLNFTLRN